MAPLLALRAHRHARLKLSVATTAPDAAYVSGTGMASLCSSAVSLSRPSDAMLPGGRVRLRRGDVAREATALSTPPHVPRGLPRSLGRPAAAACSDPLAAARAARRPRLAPPAGDDAQVAGRLRSQSRGAEEGAASDAGARSRGACGRGSAALPLPSGERTQARGAPRLRLSPLSAWSQRATAAAHAAESECLIQETASAKASKRWKFAASFATSRRARGPMAPTGFAAAILNATVDSAVTCKKQAMDPWCEQSPLSRRRSERRHPFSRTRMVGWSLEDEAGFRRRRLGRVGCSYRGRQVDSGIHRYSTTVLKGRAWAGKEPLDIAC